MKSDAQNVTGTLDALLTAVTNGFNTVRAGLRNVQGSVDVLRNETNVNRDAAATDVRNLMVGVNKFQATVSMSYNRTSEALDILERKLKNLETSVVTEVDRAETIGRLQGELTRATSTIKTAAAAWEQVKTFMDDFGKHQDDIRAMDKGVTQKLNDLARPMSEVLVSAQDAASSTPNRQETTDL